jgi:hypothetical protein
MRRSKVICVCFAGRTNSVTVAGGVYEGLLGDVHTVSDGTLDAFGELAVWIAGLGGSDIELGDDGRNGSGGAEGESYDGAGVHVGIEVGAGCVMVGRLLVWR